MLHEIAPYALPPLVLALFIWRALKAGPRKLRLRSMWVVPALIAFATATTLAGSPSPGVLVVLGYGVALAIGLAIGWLRARHMVLAIDPEKGHVTTKATPVGVILIVALFAIRYGLKLAFPELAAQPHGHPAASTMMWTDAALLFSCGLVWGRAVTTWLRARPLLAVRAVADAS